MLGNMNSDNISYGEKNERSQQQALMTDSSSCVLKINLLKLKPPVASIPTSVYDERITSLSTPSSGGHGHGCSYRQDSRNSQTKESPLGVTNGAIESKELDATSEGNHQYEYPRPTRNCELPATSSYTTSPPTRLPCNVSVARELNVENMPGYKAMGKRMPSSVAVLNGVVFEEFQTQHEKYGVAGTPRYEFGITTAQWHTNVNKETSPIVATNSSNNMNSVDIGATGSTSLECRYEGGTSVGDPNGHPEFSNQPDPKESYGYMHGSAHVDSENREEYGQLEENSLHRNGSLLSNASSMYHHNDNQVAEVAVVPDEYHHDNTSEWVQCDHPFCLKWRRVPAFVNMKSLPDKWVCTDNYWDASKASCDVAEEAYDDSDEDTIEYHNTSKDFDEEDIDEDQEYVDEDQEYVDEDQEYVDEDQEYVDEDEYEDEYEDEDYRSRRRGKGKAGIKNRYNSTTRSVRSSNRYNIPMRVHGGDYGEDKQNFRTGCNVVDDSVRRSDRVRHSSTGSNMVDNSVRRSGRVRHSSRSNEDFVSTDYIVDLVAE